MRRFQKCELTEMIERSFTAFYFLLSLSTKRVKQTIAHFLFFQGLEEKIDHDGEEVAYEKPTRQRSQVRIKQLLQ